MSAIQELFNRCVDNIIDEIGPQIVDAISRGYIENRVAEIIADGNYIEGDIIDEFMENDEQVKYHQNQ